MRRPAPASSAKRVLPTRSLRAPVAMNSSALASEWLIRYKMAAPRAPIVPHPMAMSTKPSWLIDEKPSMRLASG
ncbi:hypothetical protein D3C86_2205100 [compost metagenome]